MYEKFVPVHCGTLLKVQRATCQKFVPPIRMVRCGTLLRPVVSMLGGVFVRAVRERSPMVSCILELEIISFSVYIYIYILCIYEM